MLGRLRTLTVVVALICLTLGLAMEAQASVSQCWAYCLGAPIGCPTGTVYVRFGVTCATTGTGSQSTCVTAWFSPACFVNFGCNGVISGTTTICGSTWWPPGGC